MDDTKKNIILLVLTLTALAVLSEIFMRSAVLFYPMFACNTYSSQDDYFLCRLQFNFSVSTKKNLSEFKLHAEECDEWDAQLGWVTRKNCSSIKDYRSYSTNSNGFRGNKEFAAEKNKTRIIIVGDSFTWGDGNSDNETYPYYLGEIFNSSADVINMGVRGYGPDQFYIRLQRDGLKFKPDFVVVGLFIPDIHRTSLRVYSFFKPRFIIKDGKLSRDESSAIPNLHDALDMSIGLKDKKRVYSFSYISSLIKKAARLASGYKKETQTTLKIIEQMDSDLKKDNIKLLVLLIPEQGMVEVSDQSYHGVMPNLMKGLDNDGIGYINLAQIFKNETRINGTSLYQGHLKPVGNYIVARELHAILERVLINKS